MSNAQRGELMVFGGPMGSGKTGGLLTELKTLEVAGKSVVLYSLASARRGAEDDSCVMSRLGIKMSSIRLEENRLMGEIETAMQYDVVGIDEGQFFDDIVEFATTLLMDHRKIVVIATLLEDHRRNLWPNGVERLYLIADEPRFCKAVCNKCGQRKSAIHTRKKALFPSDEIVDVGGMDKYESLCRYCWKEREDRGAGFDLLEFVYQ